MAVGRPKIFENELELSKAWEEYKADLDIQAQEWVKVQYVGKDAMRVTDNFKLPYTLEGFYIFCRKNYGCVKQYFTNIDGAYNDFLPICTHIREEIRNNQIIGGLLGVYNPSITQRLNNLVERSEIDHKGEIKNTYDLSKISTDTLKELLNAATTDKPSEGGNM